MAHFAELDGSNVVLRVVVVDNDILDDGQGGEDEQLGIDWCVAFFGAGTWKQTSYNGTIRKNFAGVGHTYDDTNDLFHEPQPYASWTLNLTTGKWDPPTPYPEGGDAYIWDEATTSWVQ